MFCDSPAVKPGYDSPADGRRREVCGSTVSPDAGAPVRWLEQEVDGTFELAQGSWSLTPVSTTLIWIVRVFFLGSSEAFVLHRSGGCHLLIFTLNYGLGFSLLRGGRDKSRCCLVCRSQTTINSSYGNFAFGRSYIFLAFSPLVQTFALDWI